MIDYVEQINDHGSRIPAKLKKALNKFFKAHEECVEGCNIRANWDGAPIALIIESSYLYNYLSGEYGWSVHTDFHKAFKNTGYFPESMNSCVIGFYKN
jgi:hypothetical protein